MEERFGEDGLRGGRQAAKKGGAESHRVEADFGQRGQNDPPHDGHQGRPDPPVKPLPPQHPLHEDCLEQEERAR